MSAQTTIKLAALDDKTVTTDLDRAGYRKMGVLVKACSSFDELNKLLKAEAIDLIVINMDFKAIDAANIARHLKRAYAEKPVVLTSVRTAAKVRDAALDAGADLFVEQPLPREYFIEKLKQLLEQKTRTTERIALHGDVRYTYEGRTETCGIGDLSVSGILLATDAALKDGAPVELEFTLPGDNKPIHATGEVVRTITRAEGQGVGIRFTAFAGDSKKRMEKYVERSAVDDSKMRYYL